MSAAGDAYERLEEAYQDSVDGLNSLVDTIGDGKNVHSGALTGRISILLAHVVRCQGEMVNILREAKQ